jgi:uncharacterized protein
LLLHFGFQLLAPLLLNYFAETSSAIQTGAINLHSTPRTEACLGIMRTVIYLATTMAVVAVYKAYVRLMEKRTLTEFSRRCAVAEVRNGFLVPLLFFAGAIFAPLSLHGNLVVEGMNGWPVVPQIFGLAIMAAVCEEIFFRGLLFRLTESSLGSALAVLLSSLLFGATHYFNPRATLTGAVGIGLEAGLALSALYMLTRRLWICMSMHFTWNLINGLLGLPISGTPVTGLFRSSLRGNELLTGGEFGVEASAITTSLGIVAGVYLLVMAYKRHCFIRPYWARNSRSPSEVLNEVS